MASKIPSSLLLETWDEKLRQQYVYDRKSGALGNEDYVKASDFVQALNMGYYKTPYGTSYISTTTTSDATVNVAMSGYIDTAVAPWASKVDAVFKLQGEVEEPKGLRARLLKEHEDWTAGVLRV